MLARLACLGTHSVTGLLTAAGHVDQDWSGDYRFYARQRVDPAWLFDGLRRQVLEHATTGPVVAAIDDTHTPHTGRKMPGVKYTRDPMGPRFRVNLIRANRFIQIAMAYPTAPGQASMIPVDFVHAPPADKPPRQATDAQREQYRQQQRQCKLTVVGAQRLHHLREQLDADGADQRMLWTVGDGGYTNRHVLRQLPARTVFIGRIRSDAKLVHLPEVNPTGRKRVYGPDAPTPEQLRQDDQVPWQQVKAVACGKEHTFRIKTLAPLRWRASGAMNLRLIVIAPLAYRPSAQHRLLYRKPAYLICTDPTIPLEQVLQTYLWRWGIEVNFRDEKSVLGIGEAKVRHPRSVATVPAVGVATYGLLLLAGLQTSAQGTLKDALPLPRWRRDKPKTLCASRLIAMIRHELWHDAIRKTDFVSPTCPTPTTQKQQPNLETAVFYALRSA